MKTELNYNSFTDALLYMSYRYCIGRHTIAAEMHALDIAENFYNIMSNQNKLRTATDIRNCISNELGNILELTLFEDTIDRFKTFISVYRRDKSVLCNTYIQTLLNFKRHSECEKNITEVTSRISKLNDLIVWVNLANLMDVEKHRMINDEECFEFITMTVDRENNSLKFHSKGCIVGKFVDNPHIPIFVAEEDNVWN